MKKFFTILALVALCATLSFAGYNGVDTGSYNGSKCIHFSVAVDSSTTAAIFAVASYSSSFSTLDDVEFVISGSSAVFVSSYTACATGTVAAPNANSRYMAVGEKFRSYGRNVASIFARVLAGSTGTAVITGTIWGH